MKKILIVFAFLIQTCFLFAQTIPDRTQWHTWKIHISGVDSPSKADYLSRSLEKMNLVLFSAFSYLDGNGFVVSSMLNIDNIISYTNNSGKGFYIDEFEIADLTDSLFLNIYLLRNNIMINNAFNQKLPYLRVGANSELSDLLFSIARNELLRRFYVLNPQYRSVEDEQNN
ncbi:MAG: hypothetical protein CVU11_04910 [Bacteroidetes bacterium HGW-Bacteroidetes-6]|jgi:hypothetical protein|nr:MAG: hypothetical protein CVU11_04910 [Bacteroidetes bacterium HGW-Bacteroidetes-6]